MRVLLAVMILFWCSTKLFAQYPKWIIQFTDKNNSPYSLNNPSAYLSQKAIDRRTKQHIAIDSTDLPVNPSYIDQVLALGDVTFLSEAKWLNQVSIYCKDNATIDKINQLPFVKRSQAIGLVKGASTDFERTKESIKTLNIRSFTETTTQDTLDYGSAYNQVHIHNGEFLHNKGFTGKGITIAVLDGGFYNYNHLTAFDSMRLQNRMLGEKDFVDYDNSVIEDNAHGMYCLSTIAANVPGKMTGTAPHASFWLMRTENVANEYPIEEHNWVAAAAFADSAGADMISSSLGYYIFDDAAFNHSYNDFYKNTTVVTNGAAIAAAKGIIVTNSAGNEGGNSWKYLIFPADADSICAVGAVDNNGSVAGFSSYGYTGKIKPNIVSVGAGTVLWGTNNIPVSGSGTSFSNPNINGLIACLWQAFPEYNNMTILNAVYESSSKFNNPDNRYGFGIPDMKEAYLILKRKQNIELYGNAWLFANPDPFTNKIDIKFIAQHKGNIALSLSDKEGNTITTLSFAAEEQEVYDTSFSALDHLLPGVYTIKYTDSVSTGTVTLSKRGIIMKDWLAAAPIPLTTQLTAYLVAPETGRIHIRLLDAAGKILETIQTDVVTNNYYTIPLNSAYRLPKGVYFIQYTGTQKKTIKLLK